MKINIRPFHRTTRLEKLVEAARDPQLPSALSDIHPSRGVKSGLTAIAATTAASAAISALRRRMDGPRTNQ